MLPFRNPNPWGGGGRCPWPQVLPFFPVAEHTSRPQWPWWCLPLQSSIQQHRWWTPWQRSAPRGGMQFTPLASGALSCCPFVGPGGAAAEGLPGCPVACATIFTPGAGDAAAGRYWHPQNHASTVSPSLPLCIACQDNLGIISSHRPDLHLSQGQSAPPHHLPIPHSHTALLHCCFFPLCSCLALAICLCQSSNRSNTGAMEELLVTSA